jgi:hypothetical protein
LTFVKGQKFTAQHRKRLSEANKGRTVWNKGLKGLPGRNKGRRFSVSWRRKLSIARLGKTPWNKGLKGFSSGNKHWNWKGGITGIVFQIRHCFEYRQWRSDIFTRDNFTCVLCLKRGGELNADHYPKTFSSIIHEYKITSLSEAVGCDELWNINNGRTLCVECHRQVTRRDKK